MNMQDQRPFEEEAADRLLAQYEKTLRGGGDDAYSLASLAAARGSGPRAAVRWGRRPGSARPG